MAEKAHNYVTVLDMLISGKLVIGHEKKGKELIMIKKCQKCLNLSCVINESTLIK